MKFAAAAVAVRGEHVARPRVPHPAQEAPSHPLRGPDAVDGGQVRVTSGSGHVGEAVDAGARSPLCRGAPDKIT